jgi:hypothetical protein
MSALQMQAPLGSPNSSAAPLADASAAAARRGGAHDENDERRRGAIARDDGYEHVPPAATAAATVLPVVLEPAGAAADGLAVLAFDAELQTIETRAPNAITGQSSRPDFSILIYPVISMEEGVHRGSKKNLMGETPAA